MGGGGISLFTDWFPENSFHMQLFFFASGYFYLKTNEENTAYYIKKKTLKLILPLLMYNIVYGVFISILTNFGFSIGEPVTPMSVFVSPFLFGSDFKFNSPDWFVAQLFIVEVLNVIFGKIFPKRIKYREYIIILTELILGVYATISFANMDSPISLILLGRTLYSLSWYGVGRLYRIVEKYDTMSSWKYLSLVICFQFLVLLITNGKANISFMSVVSFKFVGLHIFGIYFIPLAGIAFWLRVCRIIGSYLLKYRLVCFVGKHTFSIVENQYLGFWILNTGYYCLDILTNNILGFDSVSYMNMHNYIFTLANCVQTRILYVIMGILVPVIISYLGECLRKKLRIKPVLR